MKKDFKYVERCFAIARNSEEIANEIHILYE